MPDFLKKFLNFLTVGFMMLSFKNGAKLPQVTANHNGVRNVQEKDDEEPEVLGVQEDKAKTELPDSESEDFFIDNSGSEDKTGINIDGARNRITTPDQVRGKIHEIFTDESQRRASLDILQLFKPDLTGEPANNYLANYKIVVGEDIDYFLEVVRKGSWGTTVMELDNDDKIHFNSISLRQFLFAADYHESSEGSLKYLAQEEFFQAHQYDGVVAELYNNGYLKKVAGIDTPQEVVKSVSTGNMRAFLELFPQQKYLQDHDFGRNSYNYYIGKELFDGEEGSKLNVNPPFQKLVNFIHDELGIVSFPETFLDPNAIMNINDKFRDKYLEYYLDRGFSDEQVQIWNLVGMKRVNNAHPENSLNMKAVLELPE